MPRKFGVMLDGWTDNGTSTHYITIFACFPDKKTKQATFPLLAFSPLPDEERFDADVHKLFLEQTISIFSTPLSSIAFLVEDNASVKALADKVCVSLLECDSHRLNLAVRKYIKDQGDTEDIFKVNSIMQKLGTLKLQNEQFSKIESRTLFDALAAKYPGLEKYLGRSFIPLILKTHSTNSNASKLWKATRK